MDLEESLQTTLDAIFLKPPTHPQESGIAFPRFTFGRSWQVKFLLLVAPSEGELVFYFFAVNEPRHRFSSQHGGFTIFLDFGTQKVTIRKPTVQNITNTNVYSSTGLVSYDLSVADFFISNPTPTEAEITHDNGSITITLKYQFHPTDTFTYTFYRRRAVSAEESVDLESYAGLGHILILLHL